MFKPNGVEITDPIEIVQERFNRAARNGYLEPIIDRKGKVTKYSGQGFSNKQTTALRQITGMPVRAWHQNEVLKFSNGVLMLYLREIGYNADSN